jgi:hypothetical protein
MNDMARKKSFKRFAYLKVEDILATVQDKEIKQSTDHISKYLKVESEFTKEEINTSILPQVSNRNQLKRDSLLFN